jgi:hypothetical protein
MTKLKSKAKANICNMETMWLNTKFLHIIADLKTKGWEFFVVDQSRGRCYYQDRTVTIPKWAFYSTNKGYTEYYLCHEIAHCHAPFDNHGPAFMAQFKRLCPIEFQHYELEYKPGNASAAGIKKNSIVKVDAIKIDVLDLL